MQIAKQFDAVTLKKMGHSALLLLGGTLVTFIADNLLQLVGALGIPKEWYGVTIPVCTWIINSVKEFLKGASV